MKFIRKLITISNFIIYRKFLELKHLTSINIYKFINFKKIKNPKNFKAEWSNSLVKKGNYLGSFFNLDYSEIDEIEMHLKSYKDQAHQKHTKKFFQVVDLNDGTISLILKILQNKDKDFFDFTNSYCSGEAVIHSAQYITSKFESDDLKSSQLFHKDFASSATFKLFIYLSDVENSENGPFTFLLPIKESFKKKIRFYSIHKPLTWESSIPQKNKIEVLGKKGKVFLVDTYKHYHCGSRINQNSKERRVIVLTFRFKSLMSGVESWHNWSPKFLNKYKQI
jgi:hypothetical protein